MGTVSGSGLPRAATARKECRRSRPQTRTPQALQAPVHHSRPGAQLPASGGKAMKRSRCRVASSFTRSRASNHRSTSSRRQGTGATRSQQARASADSRGRCAATSSTQPPRPRARWAWIRLTTSQQSCGPPASSLSNTRASGVATAQLSAAPRQCPRRAGPRAHGRPEDRAAAVPASAPGRRSDHPRRRSDIAGRLALPEPGLQHGVVHREQIDVDGVARHAVDAERNAADHAEAHPTGCKVVHESPVDHRVIPGFASSSGDGFRPRCSVARRGADEASSGVAPRGELCEQQAQSVPRSLHLEERGKSISERRRLETSHGANVASPGSASHPSG